MTSRREFLSYAWLALLTAVAAGWVGVSRRFAHPLGQTGQFGGLFRLGTLSQLPAPGSPPLHEPVGRFWLVHTNEGLLALHKGCTHLDCLCRWDESSREYVCPCHGSRFAENGERLAGPAPRGLDRFALRIETPAGELVAQTDPFSGAPLPLPDPPSGDNLLLVDTGQRISR